MALSFVCLTAQAQDAVARKVEPWWLNSAPVPMWARVLNLRAADLTP
jgi:hypothetical protein